MNENPWALIPELALAFGAVLGLRVGSWLPRREQWLIRLLAAASSLVGLVAAADLLLLVAAYLLLLVAAYLLASIPLYALAGFAKDSPGTEAALKYYLMGALMGVVMLTGVTLLYGAGGATGYATLADTIPDPPRGVVAVGLVAGLAGLLFKIGGCPRTSGCPTSPPSRSPGRAAVLVVCLLGLVGTPPTAVFLGKLEVFAAAVDGGYTWLVVLAVVNTVASLFYYLRWIAPAFLSAKPRPATDALVPAGGWSAVGAYSAGAASLTLGVGGGLVLPLLGGTLLS